MGLEITPVRGVAVHYGPRTISNSNVNDTKDKVKTMVLEVGYSDVNSALNHGSFSGVHAAIPAGAYIVGATVYTSVAYNGTTPALDVGLADSAGAEIDFNGLVAAASVAAAGTDVGAGALVGTKLAADSWLYAVLSSADSTAGASKIVVEYMLD